MWYNLPVMWKLFGPALVVYRILNYEMRDPS